MHSTTSNPFEHVFIRLDPAGRIAAARKIRHGDEAAMKAMFDAVAGDEAEGIVLHLTTCHGDSDVASVMCLKPALKTVALIERGREVPYATEAVAS